MLGSTPARAGHSGSVDLERLFATWKDALWAINHSADTATEEQLRPLWRRMEAAEDVIVESPDASPRIAAMRLWIRLALVTNSTAESDAIIREDLPTLMRIGSSDDWGDRCAMRALAALIDLGGRA